MLTADSQAVRSKDLSDLCKHQNFENVVTGGSAPSFKRITSKESVGNHVIKVFLELGLAIRGRSCSDVSALISTRDEYYKSV